MKPNHSKLASTVNIQIPHLLRHQKLTWSITLSLLVTACGGGSDHESTQTPDNNGSATTPTPAPTPQEPVEINVPFKTLYQQRVPSDENITPTGSAQTLSEFRELWFKFVAPTSACQTNQPCIQYTLSLSPEIDMSSNTVVAVAGGGASSCQGMTQISRIVKHTRDIKVRVYYKTEAHLPPVASDSVCAAVATKAAHIVSYAKINYPIEFIKE